MQPKKILILGGLWYLWSHTALELIKSDFPVIIIDNFSNSHQKTWEVLKDQGKELITLYELDIRDSKQLEEIFEKEEIGIIFHFASKNKQKESCLEPFSYYEANIQGTINLLKNMEKKKIKNLIYSSSSSVYDVEKSIPPFSETDKLKARTPFATTKIITEQLLKDMNIHKHFNIFCLRYFNPIGAMPEYHLWYNPKGIPTKIVPLLLKIAKGEIESFPIYGDQYPTKDGSCLMDYIHIKDITKIHLKMVNYLLNKTESENPNENIRSENIYEIMNIGTSIGKTIKEMIEIVELVTGKKIPYETFEARTGDTAILLGNNNKLRNFFDREPQHTIIEAIEDERKYMNLDS